MAFLLVNRVMALQLFVHHTPPPGQVASLLASVFTFKIYLSSITLPTIEPQYPPNSEYESPATDE